MLLLEITAFLRETYKCLPKTQKSFFPVLSGGSHHPRGHESRASHAWPLLEGGRSGSVAPLLAPGDPSARRWSMAANSVASSTGTSKIEQVLHPTTKRVHRISNTVIF